MATATTKVVGNYELTSKLGSGSYAQVYKSTNLKTGEQYAIKAISKGTEIFPYIVHHMIFYFQRHQQQRSLTLFSSIHFFVSLSFHNLITEKVGDPKLMENLEQEIAIMRDYLHENIVQLFEHFSSQRYIYLVLELCPGGDLSKYIKKRGRIDEVVTHGFLKQISDGLQFLQSKNVIHRDLKPANILLSELSDRAILKIADFGFAKQLVEAASMAQTPCGSPLYMAPEIFEMQEYDAKADVWYVDNEFPRITHPPSHPPSISCLLHTLYHTVHRSVGCIFYEMLVGCPPFKGSNPRELFQNIRTKQLQVPTLLSLSHTLNLLSLRHTLLLYHTHAHTPPPLRLTLVQPFHSFQSFHSSQLFHSFHSSHDRSPPTLWWGQTHWPF